VVSVSGNGAARLRQVRIGHFNCIFDPASDKKLFCLSSTSALPRASTSTFLAQCPGPGCGLGVLNTTGTGCWTEGDPFSGVQPAGLYWSSSSFVDSPTFAWRVSVSSGFVFDDDETNLNHVWPVRGGP